MSVFEEKKNKVTQNTISYKLPLIKGNILNAFGFENVKQSIYYSEKEMN